MRCQACDKNLNDWESVKKNDATGDYEDLCSRCLNSVRLSVSDSQFVADAMAYESEDALDHVRERPSDFDYYEGNWDGYEDD